MCERPRRRSLNRVGTDTQRHVRDDHPGAHAPGTVDSPWIGRMIGGQPDPVAAREKRVERQPLGRLGRSEEIARAVLYLASPEVDFVHGTCLVIDGGFSAR
jgi:NAD(P)-dependent dehydrogenase (short-subunit alcohol dehydrogenase family)